MYLFAISPRLVSCSLEFLQPQMPAFHSQWRMDCLLGCFVVLYTVSSAFAGLPFSMRSPCAWVFWSISNNHMCPLLQRPPGQLPVGHLLCSFLRLGVLGPHCTFGPKLTRREDLRCFILLWRLKKKIYYSCGGRYVALSFPLAEGYVFPHLPLL